MDNDIEVIAIDEDVDIDNPPPIQIIPAPWPMDINPAVPMDEEPIPKPLSLSPRMKRKRKYEQMEEDVTPVIDLIESNTNNTKEAAPVQPEITSAPPPKRRKLNPNLSTLSALSQTPDFSDITFKVDSTEFFGLKAIFAIKSAVFQDLLYPQTKQEVRYIEISNISVQAFVFIRDFFYDLNPQLSFRNVVKVLNAAKIYDIQLIQTQCNAFLGTIDNVNDLLSVVQQFGDETSLQNELNQVLETNVALLQNNGSQIVESDVFKALPFFMAKRFIESDDLGIKEEDLWNNTKQWFASNAEELKQIIRFCRMETEFIFNEVKSAGVLSDGDLVSIYEKKLGLNAQCVFNCNERFVQKVKKTRRGRKKKEEEEEEEEKVEMDVDEEEQVVTPKKKGRGRGRSKSRGKSAGKGRSKSKGRKKK
eukprot:186571_1